MYEIREMDGYVKLRERHMLEGALAYLYELATDLENCKDLAHLRSKINTDADIISGRLSECLWNDFKLFADTFTFKQVAAEAERSETSQQTPGKMEAE